ncbi:hypothetical protein B0H15DRAFT_927127 [Mycena belliarum]|uniref:Oxidoreductase AflY n=1 Tax=Mycena belliarum TaxID=1033014 RepID=A0AAD6UJJ9_9AGAR|nr:hypothetical protein B0H15DRAFT_927127 [Mycena belliae]
MSTTHTIASPPKAPIQPGLVRVPTTYAATEALRDLLRHDFVSHHCFFNDQGFHNHVGHHLVSAYDLGAPPALLKRIYEATDYLRPLDFYGPWEEITEKNWTTRLGDRTAYASYVAFFSDEIQKNGAAETIKRYIMAPEANGNGAMMFARFFEGVIHPFLQAGYGVEVGQDYMIAQGIATGAVTELELVYALLDNSGLPELGPPTKGVTLLALLREIYDSPILVPPPYKAGMTSRQCLDAQDPTRAAEIKRICSKWSVDASLTAAELDARVEECLWLSTLLIGATSRPGRTPRMHFFMMHLLTSATCLPSLFKVFPDPVHKAQLLQGYLRLAAALIVGFGRPRIDIQLLMSYTEFPRPPVTALSGAHAVGDPSVAAEADPWPAIVLNSLYHREPHVVKAVRALYYSAQRCGTAPSGSAPGAFAADGTETHVGSGKLDGTVFVRTAGVLSETMGWVAFGAKDAPWDFSALGYDAAWDGPEA